MTSSVGLGKTNGFSVVAGLAGKGGLFITGLEATGGLDNCPSELDFSGTLLSSDLLLPGSEVMDDSDFDWLADFSEDSESAAF